MTGTVKKVVDSRGFGFIALDDRSADVFFHAKSVQGCLFAEISEGDRVEFELDWDHRHGKEQAVDVRLV